MERCRMWMAAARAGLAVQLALGGAACGQAQEEGVTIIQNGQSTTIIRGASKASVVASTKPAGDSQAKPAAAVRAGAKDKLNIAPSEVSQVRYVNYRDPSGYFTMQIPAGWKVRTGLKPKGDIDLISYAITMFDPKKPDRELYFNLNAAYGVKSQAAHEWQLRNYGPGSMFAQMPVVSPLNTEGFFAGVGPLYGFQRFRVLESLGKTPIGGDALIAECVSARTGAPLQGLFHAVVSGMKYMVPANPFQPMGPQVDVGVVTEFVVLSEVTPQEEFVEWQPVLDHCLGTIAFSEAFQQQRRDAWARVMGTSSYIMKTADEVSGMIMDSYQRREATYDVLSQKRSDATLGYERVQDTETGEYYKADNGFTDWYDGKRYRPATEDAAYLAPVAGTIHWK